MRFLVAACAALALLPAGAAEARVALVFLPSDAPLLDEFASRGMAVGLTSPSVGGYERAQVFLDIGQGTRISNRVYDDKAPPPVRVRVRVRGDGVTIEGWPAVVERAEDAPGELVPGLLGASVPRTAWRPQRGADSDGAPLAAADRKGRLTTARGALRAWGRADLLVLTLAEGAAGLRELDALLAGRRPQDTVIAVRDPIDRLALLATGAIGPGLSGGRLRSATTRRDGYVAATDFAPTALERLRIEVPDEMQGQEIERVGGGDPVDDTRALADRLDVIMGRRRPVMRGIGISWLVLIALGALAGRLRAALRTVFLSALWVPALALLAPVFEPSLTAELLLIVLGSAALGALTDRLVAWPVAPALPVLVGFCAYAIDLAAGSAYTALALTGPNPKGGARFYGIGNELEAMLSLSVLLGAGAGLTLASRYNVARGFALVCLVAGLILGAGRLGADVGAVITLGAGAAAAVVMSLPGGPTRRAVALAIGVPAAAVVALVAIDLITAGGAHLTRSVVEASGPGELLDIVVRRFEISLSGFDSLSVAIAIVLLVVGFWRRRDLLEPLRRMPGEVAVRAGVAGAFAATVVGAIANDSGPVILQLGALSLLLAVGYLRGAPETGPPKG